MTVLRTPSDLLSISSTTTPISLRQAKELGSEVTYHSFWSLTASLVHTIPPATHILLHNAGAYLHWFVHEEHVVGLAAGREMPSSLIRARTPISFHEVFGQTADVGRQELCLFDNISFTLWRFPFRNLYRLSVKQQVDCCVRELQPRCQMADMLVVLAAVAAFRLEPSLLGSCFLFSAQWHWRSTKGDFPLGRDESRYHPLSQPRNVVLTLVFQPYFCSLCTLN